MLFSFGRDPIAVGHEKNIGLIISIFRFIHRIPILAKSQVCTKCLILIFGTLNQFKSTNGFCIVFFYKIRRCASRDSTNASFIKWFSLWKDPFSEVFVMKFSLYSKFVYVISTLYRPGKLLEHFILLAVALLLKILLSWAFATSLNCSRSCASRHQTIWL